MEKRAIVLSELSPGMILCHREKDFKVKVLCVIGNAVCYAVCNADYHGVALFSPLFSENYYLSQPECVEPSPMRVDYRKLL